MTNPRPMRLARATVRSAPLVVFGLLAAVAVAYTVRWHQAKPRHHGKAPFNLVARPGNRTVAAGAVTRYQIWIVRHRYRGRIKLRVVRARHLRRPSYRPLSRIALKPHGRRVTVTVRTSPRDRPGRYVVKLSVVSGRIRGSLVLRLNIRAPTPASFSIAGSFGRLWPGASQAVNVALTNPNGRAISVRSLNLRVRGIRAPRATSTLPCSAADFAVRQFTGIYPLRIPAHATRRLSDLRRVPARRPQIIMLNRPVNQDGCQGATINLSYSGMASSP